VLLEVIRYITGSSSENGLYCPTCTLYEAENCW